MRQPLRQRPFMAHRPSLELANRWVAWAAVGLPRGKLPFAPLTLVLRRARARNTSLPPPHLLRSADKVEVLVAPRLVFNLHLSRAASAVPEALPSPREGHVGEGTFFGPGSISQPSHPHPWLERRPWGPAEIHRFQAPSWPMTGMRPWHRARSMIDGKIGEPGRTRAIVSRWQSHFARVDMRLGSQFGMTRAMRLGSADLTGAAMHEGRASGHDLQTPKMPSRPRAAATTGRRPPLAVLRPSMLGEGGIGASIRRANVGATHPMLRPAAEILGTTRELETPWGRRPIRSRDLQIAGPRLRDSREASLAGGQSADASRFAGGSPVVFPDGRRPASTAHPREIRPERAVSPVPIVHRASAPAPPRAHSVTAQQVAKAPAVPHVDVPRLADEVCRQIEKRIRIERQRRGRL